MKNFKFFIGVLFLLITFSSCKKSETDNREAFVGTWTGTQTMSIPTLGSSAPSTITLTIAKGSTSDALLITLTGSTTQMTARVNGSSYVYNEFTNSAPINNIQASVKFNGSGKIVNHELHESGTVDFTLGGTLYPGTWTTVLTKQ